MPETALHALYRRWLTEVWQQGNFAVSRELIADDCIDHNPAPGQPAGRAGHDWFVQMVRTAFPDLRFTVDVVLAEGDLVSGRWTMTGTNTGPLAMLGVPATGRPVTMTGSEILRVQDGQVREMWHQEDLPGLLQQLGLGPPPAVMLRGMIGLNRLRDRLRRRRRRPVR